MFKGGLNFLRLIIPSTSGGMDEALKTHAKLKHNFVKSNLYLTVLINLYRGIRKNMVPSITLSAGKLTSIEAVSFREIEAVTSWTKDHKRKPH